jgi:hypothetical protein
MLIDNKFVYLSLPRCASTSFHISCIRHNFDVKHANPKFDKSYKNDELTKLSNMELVYDINHFHETINELTETFGREYDIISVKRNRYDRYISYFNHCIGELQRHDIFMIANTLLELNVDDILFYKSEDLLSKESRLDLLDTFLKRIGYLNFHTKLESLLLPLFSPMSVYHNNNPNIIWFDFANLKDLEDWVSSKTGKPFKLEIFGSSIDYKSNIINDEYFLKKYNEIYDYYDFFKKEDTLI